MLKKSLGLSFAIIISITAMILLSGCQNPEAPVVNVDTPVTLPEDGGVNIEFPNPNMPAPTYPVDLKPFVDGGVGWISTTVTGDADVSSTGYSVVVSYQDPAKAAFTSPSRLWNREVRLIAVYQGGNLLTLAELDPVSVFENRKLAVRLLHVSDTGSGDGYVQYYGAPAFDPAGGSWTPGNAGTYTQAPVVYLDYTISENSLTFNDGWLNPLLENISLTKMALVPELAGSVYVNGTSTYNFRAVTGLMGITSDVINQAGVSGTWWVLNNKIYIGNVPLTGAVVSDGGLSINGKPWTKVTKGGGGFANRIWIREDPSGLEYLSFNGTQVKSSGDLGGTGSPADAPLQSYFQDYYGADGLGSIYVALSGDNSIRKVTPEFNSLTGTFAKTGVYTLTEISALSATAAGTTLAGIWAKPGATVDYFFWDADDGLGSSVLAVTGVGYADQVTANSGRLFAVKAGVPAFAGTYTYADSTKTLSFSGGSLGALTGLVKLTQGTTDVAGGVRQWGYAAGTAAMRFLFAEKAGQSVISYGNPKIDLATQNLVWYYGGNDLYVIDNTGDLKFLGGKNAGIPITQITNGTGAIVTANLKPIVKPSASPVPGVWANAAGNAFFYVETRDNARKGHAVYSAGSGELYQDAVNPAILYSVNSDGAATLLGTYKLSTGFGFNETGLHFTGSGLFTSGGSYADYANSATPLAGLAVSPVSGEYANASSTSTFYTAFDSNAVSIDTGSGVVSGPAYSNVSALSASGGILYLIDDKAGGTVKRIGQFTATGDPLSVASIVPGTGTNVLGTTTVLPISGTAMPFNGILGSDKWATNTYPTNYIYKDADTLWVTNAVSYPGLREGTVTGNAEQLFSVKPDKTAVYLGKYAYTAGTPEDASTVETSAQLSFSGGGAVVISNANKLHGEGEPNLQGDWANAGTTAIAPIYVSIGSGSLKYEKGAIPPVIASTEITGTALWRPTAGPAGAHTAYALYGFSDSEHTIAYLGTGPYTAGTDTTSPALALSGGMVGATTLTKITPIGSSHDLYGNWAPFTTTGGFVSGKTVDKDGIRIAETIVVGSDDAASDSIVYGAGKLNGNAFAAITAANTYQVFVYDNSPRKNGLVYVGQLVYTDGFSLGGSTYNYFTVGAQTLVLKTGSFAKQ